MPNLGFRVDHPFKLILLEEFRLFCSYRER